MTKKIDDKIKNTLLAAGILGIGTLTGCSSSGKLPAETVAKAPPKHHTKANPNHPETIYLLNPGEMTVIKDFDSADEVQMSDKEKSPIVDATFVNYHDKKHNCDVGILLAEDAQGNKTAIFETGMNGNFSNFNNPQGKPIHVDSIQLESLPLVDQYKILQELKATLKMPKNTDPASITIEMPRIPTSSKPHHPHHKAADKSGGKLLK